MQLERPLQALDSQETFSEGTYRNSKRGKWIKDKLTFKEGKDKRLDNNLNSKFNKVWITRYPKV